MIVNDSASRSASLCQPQCQSMCLSLVSLDKGPTVGAGVRDCWTMLREGSLVLVTGASDASRMRDGALASVELECTAADGLEQSRAAPHFDHESASMMIIKLLVPVFDQES